MFSKLLKNNNLNSFKEEKGDDIENPQKLLIKDSIKKNNEDSNVIKVTDEEKIKIAFALNLCTVSISQIIDYNDVNILEQEYDAILNNINMENMPGDEELLKILKQLLDTITFFRIEEKDKEFIDKEYQQRIKNAIWNAVPNPSIIISTGNVFSALITIASQVGIGYMNYRKEKDRILSDNEREKWELHKAAIEQFNGLRRELFDTSWRLANKYKLPDEYRLTETQLKQYDDILKDKNAIKKVERLEFIKEQFKAYPPFWYFMGNACVDASQNCDENDKLYYQNNAKKYFSEFFKNQKNYNLLRENPIVSACALEYISLFDEINEKNRNDINKLIKTAISFSGYKKDIIQLCIFAYLKINNLDEACKYLNYLINEDYNVIVNSQLLSAIYIKEKIEFKKDKEKEYRNLCLKCDKRYLYQYPLNSKGTGNIVDDISREFFNNQIEIIYNKFISVLNQFQRKYMLMFNRCLPPIDDKQIQDSYYENSEASFNKRISMGNKLQNKDTLLIYQDSLICANYPYNFLNVFNKMCNEISDLSCTQGELGKLIKSITNCICEKSIELKNIRRRICDNEFNIDDYKKVSQYNYFNFTDGFYKLLKDLIKQELSKNIDIVSLCCIEMNLFDFCKKNNYIIPKDIFVENDQCEIIQSNLKEYFNIELINEGKEKESIEKNRQKILDEIKSKSKNITIDKKSEFKFEKTKEFDKYFAMSNIPNLSNYKKGALAILDNLEHDDDLMFCTNGVRRLKKNLLSKFVKYDDIVIINNDGNKYLKIGEDYDFSEINMKFLIDLFNKLSNKGKLIEKNNTTFIDYLLGNI